MIRASAPGKMILIGEYAVLEGASALVCAVDRRAEVSIQEIPGTEFSVSSPSLAVKPQSFVITPKMHVRFDPAMSESILRRLQFFQQIFELILEKISGNNSFFPSSKINLNTDAFYSQEHHAKYGFGSSAALTVSLVAAAYKVSSINHATNDIFEAAIKIHHQAQGYLGSGIDIAACTYGGILSYRMTIGDGMPIKIPESVPLWADMHILPVWSGSSASTRKMVSGVNRLKTSNAALYDELIKELSEVSAAGYSAWINQESALFLGAVDNYYELLFRLGERSTMPIISSRHQKIYEVVRRNGAFYKPSGAGSGDIGLVFSNDPDKIKRLKKILSDKSIVPLDIKAGAPGVKIDVL